MATRMNRKGNDLESAAQFESRKIDHIRLALSAQNQALGHSGLDDIQLLHEALPDLDFIEIQLAQKSLKQKMATPFLLSSMTAGHSDSVDLNLRLARACAERGWRMGVGSQRRELGDLGAAKEWAQVRKSAPNVELLGNLGLAQVIHTKIDDVERLVESLQATAMIVHLNVLQECLQPEGTPSFRGGLKAIERLCKKLSVPVVIKETGCGFSRATLKRLHGIGVAAVDVSGLGGTHWGRIEGERNSSESIQAAAARSLALWGISTVQSVLNGMAVKPDYEIWASGGVRSGLDAAKLLAMGAKLVGIAMPILAAAVKGDEELLHCMSLFEYELKTAMFCTGSATLGDLQRKGIWQLAGRNSGYEK